MSTLYSIGVYTILVEIMDRERRRVKFELSADAQEALELMKSGGIIPDTTQIKVSKEAADLLEAAAEERGVTPSQLLLQLLAPPA